MADINKLDILLPNSLQTNYSSSTQQPNVVEGDSFSDILKTALSSVDSAQHTAAEAIQQAINGENTESYESG